MFKYIQTLSTVYLKTPPNLAAGRPGPRLPQELASPLPDRISHHNAVQIMVSVTQPVRGGRGQASKGKGKVLGQLWSQKAAKRRQSLEGAQSQPVAAPECPDSPGPGRTGAAMG